MSGASKKKVCGHLRDIAYIEEILAEILPKLPVDCLLKFKLVSKYWYKLIREPTFAQLQFSCAPKDPKLILYAGGRNSETCIDLHLMDRNGEVREYVSLPNLDDDSCFQLLCSFNGLVFCTKLTEDDELAIQVLNPATRKILDIPERSPFAITESVAVLFDPENNRYKIFRFLCDESESDESESDASESDASESAEDSNCCKCEVYSSESGEWRKISGIVKGPAANPTSPLYPTHICVGGRVYWLVWSEEDCEKVPGYILSIDMDDNITRLELPKFFSAPKKEEEETLNILTFLTEYQGSLACAGVDNTENYVKIWLLTDHSESSWAYKALGELQIDCMIDAINSIVSIDNELLFIIKPGIAKHFCFHFLNMEDNTWRISNRPNFRTYKREPVVLPYTESLFRCDFWQNYVGGKRTLGGNEK